MTATANDLDGAVTQVQFFRGTTALEVVTQAPYSIQVRKLAAGSYSFSAVATDNLGGTATARIHLLAKARPTVSITTPAAGARLTAVTNILRGSASDSVGVALVEYSQNGSAFAAANGTNSWNIPLVLPAGTNVLRVRATDVFGNLSLTNTHTVFQVVTSALTLTATGNGTVTGATNHQVLEVGRGYHLLAVPGTGFVFSNWTGQASGNAPALGFLMESNMVLQANFVPNPFLRIAGTFNGLFFETNALRHESSGDFRLRVTTSGSYSARLRLAGRRYGATGHLDLEGLATNVVTRPETNSLTVAWTIDLHGSDQLSGRVTDGNWLAELQGDRAIFNSATNPCPWSGRYTFVLPKSALVGTPGGDGWGTLKATASGAANGVGLLPDNAKLVRKAPLSKFGFWPLYAPLYQSQGSLIGWVRFDTNAPLADLSGLVDWFRPTKPDAEFYPAGFTNHTSLSGSFYVSPAGLTNRVLAMTNGVLILTGGNLSQSCTNDVILGGNNRLTNASQNLLSTSLSAGTGRFKGSFFDTGAVRSVKFNGVLLQKSTNGSGFFLGTNQSGRVLIESDP